MRVLWLCNIAIPAIARELGLNIPVSGGWLSGAAEALVDQKDIELSICFKQSKSKTILIGKIKKLAFYGIPMDRNRLHSYSSKEEEWLRKVVEISKPDIVHIWGTEYPHALAMVKAFGRPECTVISIQGLCGYISKHYTAFMPAAATKWYTFRDFVKRDRIIDQQKKFAMRGRFEQEAIRNVNHVIGRTNWDRACVTQINARINYYLCNETLRTSFYENRGAWDLCKCERYSIFVSQASYPLKGFHQILEAMPIVLSRFPNAKLYTTGRDPRQQPFYRLNGYQRFIKKLIKEKNLDKYVFFLGDLDEAAMCRQYLKANVFVSASSIENSPNSVGEAMLLGVPTVASYVGGTMDLLKDKEEGFMYQADAPYMMADCICRVFVEEQKVKLMSSAAMKHASITHNPDMNLEALLDVYKTISKS